MRSDTGAHLRAGASRRENPAIPRAVRRVQPSENGKKKTITRMQAMVKRIVAGALQGDLKALMTLFEILRRTGKFEESGVEALLPDNYQSVLDSYVTQRQKAASTKLTKTSES